jgi:hypothetical protein
MSEPRHQDVDAALLAHADLGLRPDAEHAILDAVSRRVGGRRRRRRLAAGRLSPVFAVLGTLVVAAGAAAATGLWNPSLGDDDRGRPSASASEVPAEQLERFSILRRPAAAADRDAVTEGALRYLNGRFAGVRTERIRAARPSGSPQRLLVVPVERSDTGIRDALCLYAVEGEGGGIGCWSTSQVLAGQATLTLLPPSDRRGSPADPDSLRPGAAGAVVIGVAPDGVATVAATDGTRAPVRDNVFAIASRGGGVTWLSPDGDVVSPP